MTGDLIHDADDLGEPIFIEVEWVGEPLPPLVRLTARELARGHHLIANDIDRLVVGLARSDVPDRDVVVPLGLSYHTMTIEVRR